MLSEQNSKHNIVKITTFIAIILIIVIIYVVVTGVLAKEQQPAVTDPKQEIIWTWSDDYAEANIKINKGDEELYSAKATVTSERTEPTCETDGQIVYTATVEYDGKTYTETKTEVISAKEFGHDYEFTRFLWNKDLTEAKLEFVCKRDSSHVITRNATVTSVRQEPTCEDDGIERISAILRLDDVTYVDNNQFKILPKLGHEYDYSRWIWDGGKAKVEFICKHDKTHVMTVDAVAAEVSRKEATCEENGEIKYNATVTYDEVGYTDTHIEIIPAHGHKYNINWNWSADKKTAEAEFICEYDSNHVVNKSADITEEITPATAETDGQIVYTATVTYRDQKYTDVKTEVIPAGGGVLV